MDMLPDHLRIHQILPGITVLGPYERFVIWTQGCARRCPGCMSPDSRPFDGGSEVSVEEVFSRVMCYPECEGLTISGGEPFLQALPLCGLIDRLREKRDLGVILYTGYTIEELSGPGAPEGAGELLKRIDLLIDGPYIRELNDDCSLRGSSNQRVIPMTERYLGQLSMYGAAGVRPTQLSWTPGGFFLVGVPKREALGYYGLGSAESENDQ